MRTQETDTVNGPLPENLVTREQLKSWGENMKEPTPEVMTGSGAVSLARKITRLDAAFGSYGITIPGGEVQGQEKIILFAPSGVSTANFVLTGTFWRFSSFTFDGIGQSAILRWIAGKWLLVGGDATPG
jgi:hypothetical protein